MKTAYVPFNKLEPVHELQSNRKIVHDECMSLVNQFGDNKKMLVRFSAERAPDGKNNLSYLGKANCVGLFINPLVLSNDEVVPVLGATEESKIQKMALLEHRRSTVSFLNEWITKWTADGTLVCATIFILYPGSHVSAHYGVSDKYVRFHTCIQENSAALFHTEFDQPRTWILGDDFAFDDHGALHWVTFPADAKERQPRIVLSTDFHRDYYKSKYQS